MKTTFLLLVAAACFFVSCTAPLSTANTAGPVGFRYENSLAIGSDSLLKPVSVVGPKSNKDIGGSSQFVVKVAHATTVVRSLNGNDMSNPKVSDSNGVLILSWWEIDDNYNEVSIRYVNGSLVQSAIKSEARGQ